MIRSNLTTYLLAALAVLFTASCSKTPEQIAPAAPQNQTGFQVGDPNIKAILGAIGKQNLGNDLEGGENSDAKVDFNSSQPIVYGVGAAGITFDTTLAESEKILTRPPSGVAADGTAVYEESLYIAWRTAEPRTPNFILLFSGYQGVVPKKGIIKEFRIGDNFAEYGKDTIEGAQKLAQDVYNAFEGQPEDFNCLTVGLCSLDWGTKEKKDFMIITPGMLLLMAKDRFSVSRIAVTNDIPLGILNSPLDLINGSFQIDGQEPIEFGQTFDEIEGRLNLDTKTTVGAKFFGRSYSGAFLVYNRTDFDRKAETPLPANKLKALSVSGQYTQPFLMDGKLAVLKEFDDGVEISLQDLPKEEPALEEADASAEENRVDAAPVTVVDVETVTIDPVETEKEVLKEIPLQINLKLVKRENVLKFTEAFTKLLEEQFKAKFPNRTIFSRISGQFQTKTIKEYTAYVVAFDESTSEGLLVQYDLDEEDKTFSYFYMSQFGKEFDPFDAMILPEATKEVATENGRFTSLSGFKMGDQVTVQDWDLGRGEATLTMGENSTRVNYSEQGTEFIALNSDKTSPRNVASVNVGSLSVGLSLAAVSSTETERVYKVVGITSNIKKAEVTGLCESSVSVSYGDFEDDILESIRTNEACAYLPIFDAGGNGKLEAIYFPNERVRLGFADKQFLSTRIYAQESEVQ